MNVTVRKLAMSARDPDYPMSGVGLSSSFSRQEDSELRLGTDHLGLILRSDLKVLG